MLESLKKRLALKLYQGCKNAAEIIKEDTPIDTQRLYETVEATQPEINKNCVKCKIVLGGQSLYGIRYQTGIKKDVNYAIYVEMRTPFIRPKLNQITQTIKDQF